MTLPLLLLALFAGPAQTLSGKFVPLPPMPVPAVLPEEVDALCRLVESGNEGPAIFAALGEALLREGRKDLAYRAFDRAHRGGHPDPRRMQQRKDECGYVAEEAIRREEREAQVWRDALASFRRAASERGGDPDDLSLFYERYGGPEGNLGRIMRETQVSWIGGVAGLLFGIGFAFGARHLRARLSALAFAVALLCGAGALVLVRPGLLPLGAAAAATGGLLVLGFGRRRT